MAIPVDLASRINVLNSEVNGYSSFVSTVDDTAWEDASRAAGYKFYPFPDGLASKADFLSRLQDMRIFVASRTGIFGDLFQAWVPGTTTYQVGTRAYTVDELTALVGNNEDRLGYFRARMAWLRDTLATDIKAEATANETKTAAVIGVEGRDFVGDLKTGIGESFTKAIDGASNLLSGTGDALENFISVLKLLPWVLLGLLVIIILIAVFRYLPKGAVK